MKQLTILTLVLVLFACQSKTNENAKVDTLIHKEYYGNWVGYLVPRFTHYEDQFTYEKIVLKIVSINKEHVVVGQTMYKDYKHSLKGTFNDTTQTFTLKEKIDDTLNSIFEFIIIKDTLKGHRSYVYSESNYVLTKRPFVYDNKLMLPALDDVYDDYDNQKYDGRSGTTRRKASNAILRINASTTELKEDSLKNLTKLDLEIIRYTIYARHGLIFSDSETSQFFNYADWYMPVNDNVDSQLTPIEIKNIVLLKRFEKYAKENYHTFYR